MAVDSGILTEGAAIGVARNVTARKIREERLEQAVREGDVLMREADHRIKNSLQLIANLLTLQQRRVQDAEARGRWPMRWPGCTRSARRTGRCIGAAICGRWISVRRWRISARISAG